MSRPPYRFDSSRRATVTRVAVRQCDTRSATSLLRERDAAGIEVAGNVFAVCAPDVHGVAIPAMVLQRAVRERVAELCPAPWPCRAVGGIACIEREAFVGSGDCLVSSIPAQGRCRSKPG